MTVKRFCLFVALFHGLLILPVHAGSRENTRFAASSATGATAVLEFAAAPLVAMTVIPFRLDLKNADGTPLTGATVGCDLTMPSMPMPENRLALTERAGAYIGEIIFTCTQGAWRFSCVVDQPGGKLQTLVFDIPRVRLR